MNPIDLAGDYFQLDATMLTRQPGVTTAERGWTSNG
jgi:hypothetical protein